MKLRRTGLDDCSDQEYERSPGASQIIRHVVHSDRHTDGICGILVDGDELWTSCSRLANQTMSIMHITQGSHRMPQSNYVITY